MSDRDSPGVRGLAPLLLLTAAVLLVTLGLAQGLWLPNLHNGLLGLAFAAVGAYVLYQRPGHGEGRLLLVTGLVESVLYAGRQIGHAAAPGTADWWAWLGVWPTAIALGLTTLSVICYPDGRVPSPGWRWVVRAVAVLCIGCAITSAVWPVEYASAGISAAHPLTSAAPGVIAGIWAAVAHPVYAVLQLLWVVAIVIRFRSSAGQVRRQLMWLAVAAAISGVALIAGLAITHTPQPGLLSTPLVPIVAGWAIVHGRHVVAYSALSWLSRARGRSGDLASDFARAVGEALDSPRATLWVGETELHAVGVWPAAADDGSGPTPLAALESAPDLHVCPVTADSGTVGAISFARARTDRLSIAERRLLDDLASQAVLVIDHLGLTDVVARRRQTASQRGLTTREQTVLELMARGYSNAAICDELHLSIKTVEPIVGTIFTKLGLHADARDNRRVLAVLTYLQR